MRVRGSVIPASSSRRALSDSLECKAVSGHRTPKVCERFISVFGPTDGERPGLVVRSSRCSHGPGRLVRRGFTVQLPMDGTIVRFTPACHSQKKAIVLMTMAQE